MGISKNFVARNGIDTTGKINNVTITAPATSATLTLANGSSLNTSGAYSTTLTTTGTTNVTLPTSGTLATTAPATTSSAGLVQLNDTVTSTSTNLAATANTVKSAYDLAATKLNSSGGTISGDLTITGNTSSSTLKLSGANEAFSQATDVESWFITNSFSNSANETEARDLSFSSDGTKLYLLGNTGNNITQYPLSTPWDITTKGSPVTFSVATEEGQPFGMYFKPDGTGFYMVGTTVDNVYQYSCSTPWDITTSSYVKTQSVTAYETDPQAIYFSPDGLKMYILGTTGDDINQFTLSTAWDINTIGVPVTFYIGNYETNPQTISFSSDGKKCWVAGVSYNRIIEISLSTAWNISTASITNYCNIYYIQADEITTYYVMGLTGIYVNESINKAWITDYNSDRVFELTTNTPTTKISGNKLSIESQLCSIRNSLIVNRHLKVHGELRQLGNAYLGATYSQTFNPQNGTSAFNVGTALATGAFNVGTALTTGAFSLGGTATTGTMALGRSTDTNIISIGAGITANGKTQTINIANAGASGSNTIINIGSSTGSTTTLNGNTTIAGNLIVNGTTTTINATTLQVADNIVELRKGNSLVAADGGIQINLTSDASGNITGSRTIKWSQGSNRFQLTNDGSTYSNITVASDLAASATTDTTNANNITSGTLSNARLPAFTGDATSSVGTSALTLSNSGVTAGNYGSSSIVPVYTVDAKGRITSASNTAIAISSSQVSGLAASATTDTTNASNINSGTLSNGRLTSVLGSIGGLANTGTGLVKLTNGTASIDSSSYLTGNQNITVSGDVSGSGATTISLTLANTTVVSGSYGSATAAPSFTVDSKGRLTAAGTNTITPAWASITSKPTTISGYGITDSYTKTEVYTKAEVDAAITAAISAFANTLYV